LIVRDGERNKLLDQLLLRLSFQSSAAPRVVATSISDFVFERSQFAVQTARVFCIIRQTSVIVGAHELPQARPQFVQNGIKAIPIVHYANRAVQTACHLRTSYCEIPPGESPAANR
jgi:hypothetical protein